MYPIIKRYVLFHTLFNFIIQDEHVNVHSLLEAPQNDPQMILKNRFPVPRYIVCDQRKSNAR